MLSKLPLTIRMKEFDLVLGSNKGLQQLEPMSYLLRQRVQNGHRSVVYMYLRTSILKPT